MHELKELLEKSPFWDLLGIEIVEARPSHAVLQMEVRPEFFNPGGIIHGGVASTLIDSAVAVAIWPTLAPGEFPTTIDLHVHYLKPVTQGALVTTCDLIQRGGRICVGQVVVTNNSQQVAFSTATYMILSAG